VDLRITVKGLDKAEGRLTRLGKRAIGAKPVMEKVLSEFETSNRRNWSSSRWAPLAKSTVAFKAKHGLDPRPMRRMGALEASLTQHSAKGAVRKATKDEAVLGTTVFYARFSQNRKKVTKSGQPQRKVVVIRPTQRKKVRELIREWVIS
jgi:phage gpG-like protein